MSSSLNQEHEQLSNPSHPYLDPNLRFSEYISLSRQMIKERRPDLQDFGTNYNCILDANSPFESYPSRQTKSLNQKFKYGVLCIHGLLDSPFTFREIANYLQKQDILCKSILLPGHGTKPEDLLSISYQEWIEALHYGIENLRKEVDNLFVIGYSTGATITIFQALKDSLIAGIILLSPAVQIKMPMFLIKTYEYLKTKLHCRHSKWINKVKEIDYAKYRSIPFNAVKQVETLTQIVKDLREHHRLNCPLFMCMSGEDETISSTHAINFFSSYHHQQSKLLLYSKTNQHYLDKRIIRRSTQYPHLQVSQFSHISIPFSLDNPHYGIQGDFLHASRMGNKNFIYGAYDLGNISIYDLLYKMKLINKQWRGLTYNPDFTFMMEEMVQFIML